MINNFIGLGTICYVLSRSRFDGTEIASRRIGGLALERMGPPCLS
jgi:hypothetical protein